MEKGFGLLWRSMLTTGHMLVDPGLAPGGVRNYPRTDLTGNAGICLSQRLLKRRGGFLAVEYPSHAIPLCPKSSQAILHALPLMRWGGFNLRCELFHLLLKAVEFSCDHTNRHVAFWIVKFIYFLKNMYTASPRRITAKIFLKFAVETCSTRRAPIWAPMIPPTPSRIPTL